MKKMAGQQKSKLVLGFSRGGGEAEDGPGDTLAILPAT
jgi:hypothetical protein